MFRLFVFLSLFNNSFYSNNRANDSLRKIITSNSSDSIKILAYSHLSLRELSNKENVLAIIEEMKTFVNNLKTNSLKALGLRKIGITFHRLEYYDIALEYYIRSSVIYQTINNKEGLANCYNNIAAIYASKGQFLNNNMFLEKSIEYHEKNITIRKLIDTIQLVNTFNNLGLVYMYKKEFEKAYQYFLDAHYRYLRANDLEGLYTAKTNLAEVIYCIGINRNDKKKLNEALDYANEALNFYKTKENSDGYYSILTTIGNIAYALGDYKGALEYCDQAFDFYLKTNDYSGVVSSSEVLLKIFENIGDLSKALYYTKTYYRFKDSLTNERTNANTSQLMAYVDIKERENKIKELDIENKLNVTEAKNNKMQRNFFVVGFVIVLLLAFFVFRSYNDKKRSNAIISQQKHLVEEKQRDILDSINYAKRIQYTLLAHDEFLKENIPEHFTYFNPKDIVSGDFYWATKHNDKFYLTVCDSTGHGVPGAFMSLLNIGFLSEAINEKGIEKPNEVFDYVRIKLTNTISKEGQKDGFDGILICFDQKNKSITYAAANNAPIIIQNNQLVELQADRMPVGVGERKENFTLHTIEANKGDTLYLYTDGYADQFGGPKGKKFKYKQLNQLLISMHAKPLTEQHTALKSAFEKWRGDLEQVDDVCVIGIRI